MSITRHPCMRGGSFLAEAYGWLTEGFDPHDLKEAKGVLDEL
jgi:hypothetical protein